MAAEQIPGGMDERLVARLAAVVAVLSLAFFGLIAVQSVTSVGALTRDPTVTAEEPWYLGAASSLGAIGWSMSAAFFALSAFLTWRFGGVGWAVLAAGCGLSFLLLVDDLFLLHDDILLRLVGSEEPVYGAYVLLALIWMAAAYRFMASPAMLALVLACVVLGASVLIDLAWDSESDTRLLFEDGLKFAGIWLWALFAAVMGTNMVEVALGRDR